MGTGLRRGRQEHPARSQSPGRPAAFSLPALSCQGRSPSTSRPHQPAGQPTCKTEPHRNYPPGWRLSRTPGFLSFPNFPPPVFLSTGFVRVPPGFTLLQTLCLQNPTSSRVTTSPRTKPRGRRGGVWGREGQSWEAARGCRCTPGTTGRRWGAGEVLQRHFAN